MGDFNEVRCREERWGTIFDSVGANTFNSFIANSGLNDVQLEAYPHLAAVCLDRRLSDHRPILLKEVTSDFGPSPFRVFHSWLDLPGFDMLISNSWNSFVLNDPNNMIRFKKKLQLLKKEIRSWILNFKRQQVGLLQDLKSKLCDIDKQIDQGSVSDDLLLSRLELLKLIHEMQSANSRDIKQKAKIQWAIKGDENSKYFHAIINKKRATLSVKGTMVDGDWITDPELVKHEFIKHFEDRQILDGPFIINEVLSKCKLKKQQMMIFKVDFAKAYDSVRWDFLDDVLNSFGFGSKWRSWVRDQISVLEAPISNDEIRAAVWGCGVDKSLSPDGFTFEFFRKFWNIIGPDFCLAMIWFFDHGGFADATLHL
uniref:RNA-directed DNA polymerase, eukaryota n=1 Tax=Tanacetum cinerariifolium TaxID=118510 RepID=A0A6L2MEJ4_TANCI|nr:RNA-directed DNA polymerase, eukaryota [Tanacetum cinerariifolium]